MTTVYGNVPAFGGQTYVEEHTVVGAPVTTYSSGVVGAVPTSVVTGTYGAGSYGVGAVNGGLVSGGVVGGRTYTTGATVIPGGYTTTTTGLVNGGYSTGVVSGGLVSGGAIVSGGLATTEVIKGESRIEYIPFEQTVTDYEERQYVERVPRQRTITEYEERRYFETVPREVSRTDYYTIEHVKQYVPEVYSETQVQMVPVERVVTRTEYIPVERKIVHYPEQPLATGVVTGVVSGGLVTSGAYLGGATTTYARETHVSPAIVGGATYVTESPAYVTGGQTIVTGGPAYVTGGPAYVTGGQTIVSGGLAGSGATYLTGAPVVTGGVIRRSRVGTSVVGAPIVGGTVIGGTVVGGTGIRSSRVVGTTYTTGAPTVVGGYTTLPGVSAGHVVGGGIAYETLSRPGAVYY